MNKKYTAAEIANMRLPGLPTTKANVLARANSEGWTYEEQKGVGGTRRLYEIPLRYLADKAMLNVRHATNAATEVALQYGPISKALRLEMQEAAFNENLDANQLMERFKDRLPQPATEESQATPKGETPPANVVATIAGGNKVDPALLERVLRVMDEWAVEQNVIWVADRKSAIAALLYDYIDKGATGEDVTRLLRTVK